jgi:hypothetical protein
MNAEPPADRSKSKRHEKRSNDGKIRLRRNIKPTDKALER